MVKKKCLAKERQWRDVLKRQAASRLSIREFCELEGVSQASFYAWRRELAERDRDSTAASSEGDSHAPAAFIPLKLVEDLGSLEILHPRGYAIRIKGTVDAQRLHQILEVLDQRGSR